MFNRVSSSCVFFDRIVGKTYGAWNLRTLRSIVLYCCLFCFRSAGATSLYYFCYCARYYNDVYQIGLMSNEVTNDDYGYSVDRAIFYVQNVARAESLVD